MRRKRLRVTSYKRGRPLEGENVSLSERKPAPDASFDPYEINADVTIRRAKELFILYGWSKSQLLELGIPEGTLNGLLYDSSPSRLSWTQEKEIFHESVFRKLKDFKAEELKEVTGYAVGLIKKNLMEKFQGGEELTVKQIKDLVEMVHRLDPIIRLEENKPTQITAKMSMTAKDIEALVKELDELDPLFDYSSKGRLNH